MAGKNGRLEACLVPAQLASLMAGRGRLSSHPPAPLKGGTNNKIKPPNKTGGVFPMELFKIFIYGKV
jgi:hypothetical protein